MKSLPKYGALFYLVLVYGSACGSASLAEAVAATPNNASNPPPAEASPGDFATADEAGAIWVVDAKGHSVGGEVAAAADAYLDGQGLTDGAYYYQVTDTLCRNLLAGPGAEFAPDSAKKPIEVRDGKFEGPLSLMPFLEWYEDYEHADAAPWTYKVWITRAPGFQASAPGCFGFDEAKSVTTTFIRRPITILADGKLQVTDDGFKPVAGNVFPSRDGIRFYAVAPSGGYYYQVTDLQCATLLAGPFPDNGAPDTAGEYVNSYSGRLYSPLLSPFDVTPAGAYKLHLTSVEQLGDKSVGCFGFLPGKSLSVDFVIQ